MKAGANAGWTNEKARKPMQAAGYFILNHDEASLRFAPNGCKTRHGWDKPSF